MEEKTINIAGEKYGKVNRATDDSIAVVSEMGGYFSLGYADTARRYAHAILELIGDPVPGKEPVHDDTYIAVVKASFGYFLAGRITGAVSGPMSTDTAIKSLQEDAPGEEYHIFRRVATVGPIPQPERKVTRYA